MTTPTTTGISNPSLPLHGVAENEAERGNLAQLGPRFYTLQRDHPGQPYGDVAQRWPPCGIMVRNTGYLNPNPVNRYLFKRRMPMLEPYNYTTTSIVVHPIIGLSIDLDRCVDRVF
ncbi:hypothetical protein TIFTF001_017028 [Ficus carica]|uniref:Uncharacterized protein n=1 Tax=Ficus carica TaxID=3494 RepID=A0AA88D9A1_FICCA|nr:hypothetical protein TIFTF001_017028 [Ficus carica]